jgi:hypothetical protein
VHLVQRDLAHLGLAGLDVRAQQQRGLVAAPVLDGAQDLRVLLVGRVDAHGLGEVQPPDDADALGDVGMHPGHLAVANGPNQRCVEFLVHLPDGQGVVDAVFGWHQPGVGQLAQGRPFFGLAQTGHRVRFQQDAQVVELVKGLEVQR